MTKQLDFSQLGTIIYEHDNNYVCEHGTYDSKRDIKIAWHDISILFIGATREAEPRTSRASPVNIAIQSSNRGKIRMTLQSVYKIGEREKSLWETYDFIVSKILERQWTKLASEIKNGNRVSFNRFEVSLNYFYFKKSFGRRDRIKITAVSGCRIEKNELILQYVDDNGRLRNRKCGFVYEIPNFHLARVFISTHAQKNLDTAHK